MSDSRHFYRALPVCASLEAAIGPGAQHDVPADWWVVIADILGSTEAIAAGHYKAVNTVGVACIAAVLNVDRSIDIPYLFGGDGATLAIPDHLREAVIVALRGTQRMAETAFQLRLRAGLVRVGELQAGGDWVRLARLQLSPAIVQPAFSGWGWGRAEQLVKAGDQGRALIVDPAEEPATADFTGFECRWQNVPSFRDHKLAIIVVVTDSAVQAQRAMLLAVLAQIEAIFGDVSAHHPLRSTALHLSFSPRRLAHEWRVRSHGEPLGRRLRHFARLFLLNLAGVWLFRFARSPALQHWRHYRDELVENSDFRKFDGALRMVLDASRAQQAELETWLAEQHRAGHLAYGLHASRDALLTCLVESHRGRHVHFVDGSEGGYALAARGLKEQLARLASRR